jgi:hypothetical protein
MPCRADCRAVVNLNSVINVTPWNPFQDVDMYVCHVCMPSSPFPVNLLIARISSIWWFYHRLDHDESKIQLRYCWEVTARNECIRHTVTLKNKKRFICLHIVQEVNAQMRESVHLFERSINTTTEQISTKFGISGSVGQVSLCLSTCRRCID